MKTDLPFQPIIKDAYSHGLEDIYQLENVDISTLRKMADSVNDKSGEVEKVGEDFFDGEELDLGNSFRGWFEPSLLDEPIDVLNLSPFTDKTLRSKEILTLRPLYEAGIKQNVVLKGVGLGHLDEIERKLHSYLKDKPLFKTFHIDYASWAKAFFSPYSRISAYLLLRKYGIEECLQLSFSEQNEIKKMTAYTIESSIKKLEEDLKGHSNALKLAPLNWAEALIAPFARLRFGLFSLSEADILWQRSSSPLQNALAYLKFISDLFFPESSLISRVFYKVEEEFFAIDPYTSRRAAAILKIIKTYFLKDRQIYSLNELYRYLNSELLSYYEKIEKEEIERILELSSTFHLYRRKNGEIHIMRLPENKSAPVIL